MRTRAMLCILFVMLMAYGCSVDDPALAPDGNLLSVESTGDASASIKSGAGLVPGGYYSFRWEDLGAGYGGFERIDTRTGLANVIWHLELPNDDTTPLGLAFDLDGTMYTTMNYMDFTPENCWSRGAP